MSMVRKRKALIQLMVIGCIGGWLQGACINSTEGVLLGLIHKNAFRGMIVGIISCAIFCAVMVEPGSKKCVASPQ